MSKYIEPYLKENNLLQLSLFYFGKSRPLPERTCVKWTDEEGECKLECICKYGVPTSFEQDVYTACMRIWVRQGMPRDGITLSYSDIARELRLEPPRAWVGRIKKSLQKLAQARYEFTKCFIQVQPDGLERVDTHFSLFDSASLFRYIPSEGNSKKHGKSKLIFPQEISKNLEAKYYQWLDMAWYRALPEGLPRRLYEYLNKRRYHGINSVFTIGEEPICRWLGIMDANTTNRRKRLEKIAQALINGGFLKFYQFDVKKKQCMFMYTHSGPPPGMEEEARIVRTIEGKVIPSEEDKTAKVAETKLIASADYARHKATDDGQCTKVSPSEVEKFVVEKNINDNTTENKPIGPVEESSDSAPNAGILVEAVQWLNSIPYLRKEAVKEIASQSDFLTVYPAVRAEYERQKGKIDRPAGWVRKAFANRWQHTKGQKQERKEAQEKAREEEYKKQRREYQEQEQKSRRIIEDQERLRKIIAGVGGYDTAAMWQEADSRVPKEHKIGRKTVVKIEFCNLLIAKLNTEGNYNFAPEIFRPAFAIEIAGRFSANSGQASPGTPHA